MSEIAGLGYIGVPTRRSSRVHDEVEHTTPTAGGAEAPR
jgi:hypothetical protein